MPASPRESPAGTPRAIVAVSRGLGRALGAGALVTLAACAGGDGSRADTLVVSAAPDTTGASTLDAAPAPDAPRIALDPDGLRVVEVPTGASRVIAFGSSREEAVRAVVASRGAVADSVAIPDCALAATRFDDGLVLLDQKAVFVGWSLERDASATYTTVAGVGIGTSRAALDSAYETRVEETGLGTEFSAGGIHGLLTTPAPTGRVAALRAGTTCVAR